MGRRKRKQDRRSEPVAETEPAAPLPEPNPPRPNRPLLITAVVVTALWLTALVSLAAFT